MTFFAASVVANLSNFFFHVVMSRLLGPASYGALGSLLGIVTVVTLAVAALQAAITQTVAERRSSGNPGGDHLSLQTPFLRTALVAVACVVVIGVISPVLDSFLHLSSPTPVVFFGLFVALSVLALYPQGVLLGRLRFRTVAVALFAGAGMRFVSGVVFVEIGLGLNGAVVSSVVNGVVVLAILVWPLRHELFGRSGGVKLGLAFRTASLAVLALGGASAFVGVDSFLARHYLSRVASGYYVAGATAARIALFLPQAVTLLAFPRFAASRGSGVEARRLLTSALAAVAVLSGVAALVLLSIPHVVISILFGPRYTPAASVLGILSVAAAGVGMTSVLVYFHLARRSTLATASWLGVAVAAILISKWHSGMRSLAWIMLGVTATILLGLLAAALAQPARRRTQDITKSNLLRLTDTETMDLTVVVPYYNPGDRLRSTVEDLIRTLRAVGMSFEIITVSDGSTDGSEACLAGLDYEFLRSVKLKANQGKGEALRVGLAMGRGRYLGFIDGDGDLPGTQVASFVSLIRSHHPDIILGSKRHPMSDVEYPPLRRLYSRAWQLLVRVLFRLKVRDTQTGLKLIRRELLADVLPRMLEKHFAFDLELLVVAKHLGYREFLEAPVRIGERFGSTVSPRAVTGMILDAFAIFYRLNIIRYYDVYDESPLIQPAETAPLVSDEVTA